MAKKHYVIGDDMSLIDANSVLNTNEIIVNDVWVKASDIKAYSSSVAPTDDNSDFEDVNYYAEIKNSNIKANTQVDLYANDGASDMNVLHGTTFAYNGFVRIYFHEKHPTYNIGFSKMVIRNTGTNKGSVFNSSRQNVNYGTDVPSNDSGTNGDIYIQYTM